MQINPYHKALRLRAGNIIDHHYSLQWIKPLTVVWIIGWSTASFGQQEPYHRTLSLILKDTLHITDSMYIIPESVELKNDHSEIIRIKVEGKALTLYNLTNDIQSINISYKVLAGSPDIRVTSIDTGMLSNLLEDIPMSYRFPASVFKKTIERNKEVQYAGAFGRGLSFGNNQNVVLNSTLNLQLAGKLGDDIEINAAITDENLPIQADGNTQQLNEIDQVYIEIKRKDQILLAGDQQLKPDDTYFLKYYKKYKGLQFITKSDYSNGGTLETKIGGAIARGNYKRQTLEVQEANQGPYRLTGNQGELFIIVLSGSEKVYLDGILVTRGLEYDYVIDYNRSEISFTSKRLINRNSRVVIEFEFSNQSYLKSAWSLQSKYQRNNLTMQWNSYSEGDNKNSNILQTLTPEDKILLSQAGDQLSNLARSTIRKVDPEVESNTVIYSLTDTVVQGTMYSNILSLSQKNIGDLYTAQFNYVGPGQGNYIIDQTFFSNGRAYKWISPDPGSGIKKGSYEPVSYLTAPKKQMQHSFWIEYKPANGLYTKSEISLSNLDLNQYSTKNKADDYGLAWKQQIGLEKKLNRTGLIWKNEVSIEKLSQNFNPFEFFRNPEFNRDWSLPTNANPYDRSLLWAWHTGLHQTNLAADYTLQKFALQDDFHGTLHSWNLLYNHAGTTIKSFGSAMYNESDYTKGSLVRPSFELIQSISQKGHHVAGIMYNQEVNIQSLEPLAALAPSSFAFNTLKGYTSGSFAGNKSSYRAEYSIREDKTIEGDHFDHHYKANEFSIENQWKINDQSQWSLRAAGRRLTFDQIKDPLREKNSNNLLLRQSFATRSRNNAIRFSQTFETGKGQEPSIEYTYVRVNKGQGYYTWIDVNNDSTIQVTEFELAPFTDQGEYLRYAITGNDFVSTKNYLFLQNIELDGLRLLQPNGEKKWFHRLSYISTWNYNWKLADGIKFSLPVHPGDAGIISLQGVLRNQVFFNKGGQQYELQVGQALSTNKWRVSTGFEIRNNNEFFLRSRHRINRIISIENYLASLNQSNEAELFTKKNFSLSSWIIEPKINFQYRSNLRVSGSYRYKTGDEIINHTHTEMHEAKFEIYCQPKSTWSLRGMISSVWASLSREPNPWTQFSILQGLRPGKNLLLQLNIDKEINQNTTLRLGYDGRQSEGGSYIQTGRAQVLASF